MEPPDKCVLLLDDAPGFTEILAAFLAESGIRLITATDVSSALHLLTIARPCAVIIEFMLLGWEAFEAVAEIRRLAGASFPVVMMNGMADESMTARARVAGVNELLIHPQFEELHDALMRVCQGRADHDSVGATLAEPATPADGPSSSW